MTKKALVISWLRWFEANVRITIQTIIDGTEEDDINPDWISHHLEENILQDLGKLETGLKKDLEKLEFKNLFKNL
jgi:hypothetical protein